MSVEDIAADPGLLSRLTSLHRRHGTTRTLLSLVSAPLGVLAERLERVGALVDVDPLLLGVHLEGPFLAASHRGAHVESALRPPDAAAVDRLRSASGGALAMMTLAPELPGADAALRALVDAGIVAAVGHTAADYDIARAAFARGATVLTHAFNGMRGIHHRAPGPVTAALESPAVVLEIIADGVHVHPSVVSGALRAATGRVALVSDAMAAAGAPNGSYRLGDLDVVVQDGVATHGEHRALAGSTLTLDRALATAVDAGVPFTTAVAAVTSVPARVLGAGDRLGLLEPGYRADAVLLRADLTVAMVWAEGDLVHGDLCDRERKGAAPAATA